MIRVLKLLIETNLFIAIAAVCFMWSNVFILDIYVKSFFYLSAQIFFSTWFVYQISRWIYYKKGAYANKDELVLQWFEKYPSFNKITIYSSGFLAAFFTFFLKFKTILVLCFIGGISVLYPIPFLKPFGINTRLRDFPFVKIFLIALVWSTTSVILPYLESSNYQYHQGLDNIVGLLFLTQFIYILFITLPFDINDYSSDKTADIKTIPVVFGIKKSKNIAFVLGIVNVFAILYVYMLVNWKHIPNKYLSEWSIILICLLIFLLQGFTYLKSDHVKKWIIKLVYDGSMILYFLIIFLFR